MKTGLVLEGGAMRGMYTAGALDVFLKEDVRFQGVMGVSAGALHILCGILAGFGISYMFRRRWLALAGTIGTLGACICLHAIYNLLITADGGWRLAGYLLPSGLIVLLFAARQLLAARRPPQA